MKRFLILTSFLLAIIIHIKAANYQNQVDSLNSLLEHTSGLEKADVLYQLARLTAPWDQVLCKTYIDGQQELLEGVSDNVRLGNFFQNQAFYYYYQGKYVESLDNFNKSTLYYQNTQVLDQVAINYYLVVIIMFNTGNLEKGMELIKDGLEIAKQSGDPWTLAVGLYGTGYFYNNNLRDFEKSKEINGKAYKIAVDYNLASYLKGGTLAACALAYFGSGQTDTAFSLFHRAIQYYEPKNSLKDKYMLIQGYHGIGTLFQKTNQFDSAQNYYLLALDRADEMTAVFAKTYIYTSLGSLNLETGDVNQAIKHLNAAVENALIVDSLGVAYLDNKYAHAPAHAWDVGIKLMAPRMLRNFVKNYLLNAYGLLSVIYEKQGVLDKSIYFLKKKHEIERALSEISKSKDLMGLQIAYETESKNQQIILLSQENELNVFRVRQSKYLLFGLAGLVILIIVFFVLYFRQNKLKAEQHTILLEQKLLRSQMNPHFIFNALSNISNLIDKNDNATASRYLTKFSRLVRHILESTSSDYIELDQEISNLENYLALQKLRFIEKFDYKIHVDDEIDAEAIEIPPMMIQPFVENAIEHGIKPKETKGHVDISIKMTENQLVCVVDDDGIGRREASKMQSKTHRSMATSITLERLKNLNRKLRQKISLEIIDLKTETNASLGTRVVIGLPFKDI